MYIVAKLLPNKSNKEIGSRFTPHWLAYDYKQLISRDKRDLNSSGSETKASRKPTTSPILTSSLGDCNCRKANFGIAPYFHPDSIPPLSRNEKNVRVVFLGVVSSGLRAGNSFLF